MDKGIAYGTTRMAKVGRVRRNITGDIVMVVDPNAPRGSWILGKVLTIEPDNKGLVCSVTLKTKTSIIKRPVSLRRRKLSSTSR